MDEVFFPISKFEHINSNLDEITRIKELSLESKRSFIFNNETLNFLKVNLEESDYYVLDVLNKYVSKRINLVDSKNNNNNLINKFLIKITSKITLEVKGYQEKIMEDGELGISFELYSNNKSKGFINLINVISAFIEMQNNENGLIVIDDIDTSINEYLLKRFNKIYI